MYDDDDTFCLSFLVVAGGVDFLASAQEMSDNK